MDAVISRKESDDKERTLKIFELLSRRKERINGINKGKIEIHWFGKSTTISLTEFIEQ